MDNFESALDGFINQANTMIVNYNERVFKDNDPEFRATMVNRALVEISGGRKFVKLVANGSVHSFVEKSTGDVYKPASWNARAKHARGNIYRNNGIDALTANGSIRYL